MGSVASKFQPTPNFSTGLLSGSGGSACEAAGVCFYMSRNGVMAYSGGRPQSVHAEFGGETFTRAVAGSDQEKYYMNGESRMENGALVNTGNAQISTLHSPLSRLYVYDVARHMWHIEDGADFVGFAFDGRNLNGLTADGKIWTIGKTIAPSEQWTPELPVSWNCEFAPFTFDTMEKKRPQRLRIRATLEQGAEFRVYMNYDGGEWTETKFKQETGRTDMFTVPLSTQQTGYGRGDSFQMKLSGVGGFVLHAIEVIVN